MKIIRINKKGQGEFVAYVLLIGMAVGLAVLVGKWSIDQSQKASENFVGNTEIKETCGQITLSGYNNCGPGGSTSSTGTSIILSNRGYLTIPKVKIQVSGCSNSNANTERDEEINLRPQKDNKDSPIDIAPSPDNCQSVLVLPMIKIKEQEFGCAEKRIEISLTCASARAPGT